MISNEWTIAGIHRWDVELNCSWADWNLETSSHFDCYYYSCWKGDCLHLLLVDSVADYEHVARRCDDYCDDSLTPIEGVTMMKLVVHL